MEEHTQPSPRDAHERSTNENDSQSEGHEPGAALNPLVGSEVLEALGTGGVLKRAMHELIRAPDDENLERPLAHGENATVSFEPDPMMADAAADFADDFGRSYLSSVTSAAAFVEGGDEASQSEEPPFEEPAVLQEDREDEDED